MFRQSSSLLVILGITVSLAVADWQQFRGPDGAAVSKAANLPTTWGPTEGIRWKAALPGRGLSSPIIAGNRVFLTASSGYRQDRLHVLAFDAPTGKQLWERQFWATGSTISNPKTCMAAATPVTDGQLVFALFATGDLFCLDVEGNLVWYRALAVEYPAITNQVGLAASPVVWQDVLLVPLENAGESFAAGLDKRTGKNRWKIDRPRGLDWVTPLVWKNGDRPEVLFQSTKDLTAYDPNTGRLLWTFTEGRPAEVPCPIAGDGLVFMAGGEYTALRPSADKSFPEVVWKSSKLRLNYASPLFHEGRIYSVNHAGVINCVAANDGKVLWQLRLKKGPFWASPLLADGKLYLVNEDGDTSVVKLGDQPELIATNSLGEAMLATPAIADGAIYMRSDQHLFRVGR